MDKRDYTNKSQENTATYQKKARNKGTHLKIYERTKIEYMLKKVTHIHTAYMIEAATKIIIKMRQYLY